MTMPFRTVHAVNGYQVDWSPDGTRFAFTDIDRTSSRPDTLCVMNADGTGLQRVARWTWHPQWSPEGGRVLAEGGHLGLFCPSDNFIEDDRNLLDKMFGNPSADLRSGTWSPSRKAVAATSDLVLWVIDADDSKLNVVGDSLALRHQRPHTGILGESFDLICKRNLPAISESNSGYM